MYMWAITQTPILPCTYICFREKTTQCEVATESSRFFSFILDFKKLPTVFKVCINILAEAYLLICRWADLSWQIYADWGSFVIFVFITFNMQHAVVSGHNRWIKVNMYEISCKRQTTSQNCWMTSKVLLDDVGDRATCRHARFFNVSE